MGLKQGYKDSNLEMTESESVALPFGDSPIFLIVTGVCHLQELIIYDNGRFGKHFFRKIEKIFDFLQLTL